MIEIKLGENTIQVDPTLTIDRYQKIIAEPERYSHTEELLGLYLGIDPQDVKDLPVEEIRYLDKLLTLHQQPPRTDIIYTFKHDDVVYGMENDWSNITWGQWTDLEVYSQPDSINEHIHIIMALLYRPIKIDKGGKYELEKFKSNKVMERAEIFKELPIEYWFGASNFFFIVAELYITNSKTYLERKKAKETLKSLMWLMVPKKLRPPQQQDITLRSLYHLYKMTPQK